MLETLTKRLLRQQNQKQLQNRMSKAKEKRLEEVGKGTQTQRSLWELVQAEEEKERLMIANERQQATIERQDATIKEQAPKVNYYDGTIVLFPISAHQAQFQWMRESLW